MYRQDALKNFWRHGVWMFKILQKRSNACIDATGRGSLFLYLGLDVFLRFFFLPKTFLILYEKITTTSWEQLKIGAADLSDGSICVNPKGGIRGNFKTFLSHSTEKGRQKFVTSKYFYLKFISSLNEQFSYDSVEKFLGKRLFVLLCAFASLI